MAIDVVIHWYWLALAYLAYLAVVSGTRPAFSQVRNKLLLGTAAASILPLMGRAFEGQASPLATTMNVILPALVLLAGYKLTGLLFVRVDLDVENRLLNIDRVLLYRTGVLAWFQRAPRIVTEYFELSYLLVYAALPAGAVTLALSGHPDRVGRFWTIVLLAEFVCYAVLPWLQTRPPMLVEDPAVSPSGTAPSRRGPIRRLNQFVAARASIRANTIPSGHAAGAVATALAVGSVLPVAGAIFMALAVSIAAASILGRYHYVVDSVLGVLVAVAAWMIA